MSETPATHPATSTRQARPFLWIIPAGVLLLVLGYLGGYFSLPRSIQSAYQNKDCDTVLTRHELYKAFVPAFMQDQSLNDPVMECAVHTLADTAGQNGDWRAAYDAYRVYTETYPNGLFVEEARARGADILIGLAKEQSSEKKYVEAMGSLDLVLAQYANSQAADEAAGLYPDMYLAWGAERRSADDFEGAERIFEGFKAWAQSHEQAKRVADAHHELAQTYLDWGLSLQSQKKFAEAEKKFQLAEITDPESQSDSGPAAQVRAGQPKFYSAWGDHLIEQQDFGGAMQKYEAAAILAGQSDPAAAKDLMARGYGQWATGAQAGDDFLGALVLLDFAQANAATDATKTLVDQTRSELYVAFSQSDGEQARQAMQEAVRLVCEQQVAPRLPIFGLEQEQPRLGLYGLDENLPVDMTATTPGTLQRVVCVEPGTQVVGSAVHKVISAVFNPTPPYTYLNITYEQVQFIWTVTLREAGTGAEVAQTVITGGEPPPLPVTDWDIYSRAPQPQFFGTAPQFADLVSWLMKVGK